MLILHTITWIDITFRAQIRVNNDFCKYLHVFLEKSVVFVDFLYVQLN